jgi:hypothetical protein
MRIGIIGAGPAGLTCARQAIARGHDVTLFERCVQLGGIWSPASGGSYPSVRMQTSRSAFHYSDFTPPENHSAMFLDRRQVYEYLLDYAKTFGVLEKIRFDSHVERVSRSAGKWAVAYKEPAGRNTQSFDRIIVAIGELWKSKMPEGAKSSSACRIFSAKDYISPEDFAGRKTLVVGGGVSGADIASEISETGTTVHWAVRRNYFFLPRMWGAHPNDGIFSYAGRAVVQEWPAIKYIDFLSELLPGYMQKYRETGLLPRDTPNNAIHINDTIIDAVWEGRVLVRPAFREIRPGGTVHFVDGSNECYERIVFCMGYEVPEYSFIEDFDIGDLYQHFFFSKDPSLAVVNTPANVDGFGTACPFFEAIGFWVLSVFDGDSSLPSAAEMREWCSDNRRMIAKRRFYDCWLETIRIALKSRQIPDPSTNFRKYWQVVSSMVTPLNLNPSAILNIPAPYDNLANVSSVKTRVLASLSARIRGSLAAQGQITPEEAQNAELVPAHETVQPSLADIGTRTTWSCDTVNAGNSIDALTRQ